MGSLRLLLPHGRALRALDLAVAAWVVARVAAPGIAIDGHALELRRRDLARQGRASR